MVVGLKGLTELEPDYEQYPATLRIFQNEDDNLIYNLPRNAEKDMEKILCNAKNIERRRGREEDSFSSTPKPQRTSGWPSHVGNRECFWPTGEHVDNHQTIFIPSKLRQRDVAHLEPLERIVGLSKVSGTLKETVTQKYHLTKAKPKFRGRNPTVQICQILEEANSGNNGFLLCSCTQQKISHILKQRDIGSPTTQNREQWKLTKKEFETWIDRREQMSRSRQEAELLRYGNRAGTLLARLAKGRLQANPIEKALVMIGPNHRPEEKRDGEKGHCENRVALITTQNRRKDGYRIRGCIHYIIQQLEKCEVISASLGPDAATDTEFSGTPGGGKQIKGLGLPVEPGPGGDRLGRQPVHIQQQGHTETAYNKRRRPRQGQTCYHDFALLAGSSGMQSGTSAPVFCLSFPLNLWVVQDTGVDMDIQGAALNLMDLEFARRCGFFLEPLQYPIPLRGIDATPLAKNKPQYCTQLTMCMAPAHQEDIRFLVLHNLHDVVVLGLPWLQVHNPVLDWKSMSVSSWGCQGVHGDVPLLSISPSTPSEVPEFLSDYRDIFDEPKSSALPPHRDCDCAINLIPGSNFPKGRLFNLSVPEHAAMRSYIKESLEKGHIRPSSSPLGAGFFFVAKKDGSLRPCIDYRLLNKITVKFQYPLPLLSDLFARIKGASWFTKIDLRGVYNLVRIKQGDEWKTAFNTPEGHFEYLAMPFGLSNAPSVFQSFMHDIFREYLDRFMIVYLDDILVFSDDWESHVS
ncbi:unnamed protein product [Ranitomeya imitator]|uniref:ribonuclease H n=1 Tax=Ranitomeya imitator TaxID=111125 RepID=A0ABN9KQI2_9NEOB|nr:unnamed protein product [Ranitomeya imitator]